MTSIKESIQSSLQRALQTFQTFPVTLVSAVGFTIVTLIRIWMDWPQQEDYNLLFNCLHLAFASAAIFGMAAITAVQKRFNHAKAFAIANGAGAAVGVLVFLLLYFLGGESGDPIRGIVRNVSNLSAARTSILIAVSLIGFIYFAGETNKKSDFAGSLFMTQKAFLIAAIYGGVMMGGTSGVAGAVQALLYRNMSSKVYMVLGAMIGLLAFAIFVGYFPDFKKGSTDPHQAVAEKQPRFIEVLFEFIMIPIVVVLTIVLLSWAVKTVVTGDWPTFGRLFGIVTSYSIGGIWLAMMTAKKETDIKKFYHRVYPIALLVILAFGAWAFAARLNVSGMKGQEYAFALTFLASVASALLLLLMKNRAHAWIACVVCVILILSVSPILGYYTLPARSQLNRLETLLVQEEILVENRLIPVATEPDEETRIAITDAVHFLAYEEEARLPEWFDEELTRHEVFKTKLGFEPTWEKYDSEYPVRDPETMGMSLMMPNMTVDISEYDWAVYLQRGEDGRYDVRSETLDGERGTYRIEWMTGNGDSFPNLTIWLEGEMILQEDLKGFMDETADQVRSRSGAYEAKSFEEISEKFETADLSVLLVFQHMDLFIDPQADRMEYYLDLNVVYLKEK